MMKKIENGLNTISIMSWVVTAIIMCVIWYLSLNDVSFRMAWNDVNRFCNSESIIALLHKFIVWSIMLAGSTNLIASLIRKLTDKSEEEYEDDYEEEKEESN